MDKDRIEELFAPLGPVTVKRMFSGLGIYADGLIFAIALDGEFFLKTDAETKELLKAAGSRPFSFLRKGRLVETSYWSLPEDALDNPEELRRWSLLALAAARRSLVKDGKKAPKKPVRKA